MSDQEKTKDDEVLTITKSGAIVANRIKTANQALDIFSRLRNNNTGLALLRSRLRSMFDGNAPLPRHELKRRGLGWMSNLDWGEFRSIIRSNSTAIWNMFNSAENLISLTPKKNRRDKMVDYGSVVAQAFSKVMRSWNDYFYELSRKVNDMGLYGYGITIFPDPDSFEIRTVPTAAVLVSAKESMIPGRTQVVYVRDEMNVDELVSKIEAVDPEDNDSGWNINYSKQKIVDKVNSGQNNNGDPYGTSEWESVLQIIKSGDPQLEPDFDGIKVVHLFVKEIEKNDEGSQVSHYIFYEGDDKEKAKFMYEADREYKNMQAALSFLFFEIGNDAIIKSVRGMGKEIYPFAEASNRLLNSLMNGVVQASGLIVKANSQSAAEKFATVRKGNVTILPFDVQPLQQQMAPSIGPAMEARHAFLTVQHNNIGTYQNRSTAPGNKVRTAEEVKTEARNEARFEADQAEWYYMQHQVFLLEIFRRMMDNELDEDEHLYEIQKMFFDILDEENVPTELRKSDAWHFAIAKAIGLGNPQLWRSITTEMMRMAGGLDEYGRHLVKREWWAARVGWERVDSFVPPYTRDNIPTFQHGMAESEQVDILSGNPRTVTFDDSHVIHLNMHFKFAQGVIARLQEFQKTQQGNPVAIHKALLLLAQHNAGHLALMAKDEGTKSKVPVYEKRQDELVKAVGAAEQMAKAYVKKQQEAQKKQQKEIEDLRKRANSAEVDLEKERNRHDERVRDLESLHESRMSKVETSNAAKLLEVETDNAVKFAKLEADLEVMRAKMGAERLEGNE